MVDLQDFKKENPESGGFLCIDDIFNLNSAENLAQFALEQEILGTDANQPKNNLIEAILSFYKTDPQIKRRIDKERPGVLHVLGEDLAKSKYIAWDLAYFDFVAQMDMFNVFADFCADLKINVFRPKPNSEYGLHLFLTKKDPLLKTEAVLLLTGHNVEEQYRQIFFNLGRAGEISDWTILALSPLAVLRIGYSRLIEDMKKLNCWVYVVDPVQMRVFGLLKGGKSDRQKEVLRDEYIKQLPAQPIRATSQVVKISKYGFNEKESYKPKNFSLFYVRAYENP